jgi:ferrous iron transport protein B
LMTCSARLPVYALLLAFLFKNEAAWKPGLALAALYLGSMLIGALAAGLVNKFLPKKEATFFMMELPLYRRPRVPVIFKQALTRTYSYIRRAGPVILVLSVIIWFSSNFPHYEIQNPQQKLEQSYLGQVGHVLEPIFRPMGSDWRVGVGLISAFAAREVFVASLAIVFNVTDNNELTQQSSLLENMRTATFPEGGLVFTGASVIALIIFFMIALQCMSTVAISIKENNSWKYAISQLVIFNIVAYILAVGIYQWLHHFPGMGGI